MLRLHLVLALVAADLFDLLIGWNNTMALSFLCILHLVVEQSSGFVKFLTILPVLLEVSALGPLLQLIFGLLDIILELLDLLLMLHVVRCCS